MNVPMLLAVGRGGEGVSDLATNTLPSMSPDWD